MRIAKIRFLLLLLCMALTLCGCRTRELSVLVPPQEEQIQPLEPEQKPEKPSSQPEPPADPADQTPPEPIEPPEEELPEEPAEPDTEPDTAAPTIENPDSSRKEYDQEAPAEVVPEADVILAAPSEEPPAEPEIPLENIAGTLTEEDPQANTATETLPSDEGDKMGVSEDSELTDTALVYYGVLLADRLGDLFECEKFDLYWENEADFATIHRSSKEHSLILDAGAYDVAAKLQENDLTVDAGWVQRKNPGMIVKLADSSVLGRGTMTTGSARAVRDSLLAREGWSSINACANGRVLILSNELLASQPKRIAAQLFIAKLAYPELFQDVDPKEALQTLTEEEGSSAAGIYAYWGE